MKNNFLFLSLCVFSVFGVFGQKEAANWYFGQNAGIRFNEDGTVTELIDGALSTNEGCTTISDENGNLLFYTDGITVWDRNHKPMPNANSASGGLFGDPSSSQSAIVIPKPKDNNIYYIFTVDTEGPNDLVDFGFNYSIVDLRLNNGLGDVVVGSKNINLRPDSSEKISAVVKDCESEELWVITFGPSGRTIETPNRSIPIHDTFYAYEVSENGINTTPIVSTFSNLNITDSRGYLKFSTDGTKIANANVVSGLFLYDFDADTGMVSGQIELAVNSTRPDKPQSAYGVEFSQNNKFLYVSAYYDSRDPNEFNDRFAQYTSLIQYDITAADVANNGIIIDERIGFRGALQLGLDGKIYRAMSETYFVGLPNLSVINTPNLRGANCNYEHKAINLRLDSTQGLPPFITSFFTQKVDIIGNDGTTTDLPLCEGDSFVLVAPDIPNASFQWQKNGIAINNQTNTLEVTNDEVGLYSVLIDANTGRCEDRFEGLARVTFSENPMAFDSALFQCDEDGAKDGFTLFNLNEANTDLTGGNEILSTKFYIDPSRTHEVDGNFFANTINPQTIYVKVFNEETSCFNYSELTLEVSVTDSNDATLTACDDDGNEDGFYTFILTDIENNIVSGLPTGLNISYYETYENALLERNDLGDTFTNTTPYSQTIYARVENANNCYGISEILLTVNQLPNIDTEDLTYYCLNNFPEPITINAGILNDSPSNYSYNWSSGEDTYEVNINEIGNYLVTVTNSNGCSKTRIVTVEASNIATINDIQVKDVSQNNVITTLTSGEGEYQYQLLDENNIPVTSFQESNIFENVFPGIYYINIMDIKNNCGTVRDAISVIGFPKFFTPNNDGIRDTWQVYGVSDMFQPNTKIQIFDRYGKLLKELSPSDEGWDGLFNGQRLPSDDYWFFVRLQDGRIFKSHFTLKN
ncbi:T9SS type B sorting domain-containing protein [Seonamhaeicola aphaedonensis]|uniref:Gliding motility-associated-like protein n=1 Tax=Seonamhaeicola aphaedonensis TaxID=1461338 RepID=A0A3D9H681_9FLAO|nr:T9SS type B sorting domain-containing protein [Seonamhaeicola aphaedonensis]RED44949.1 gliding motility-associated-like protein [Seonamhaeicola aphaedonensis]